MPAMVQRARGHVFSRRSVVVGAGAAVALIVVTIVTHRYGSSGLAPDLGAIRGWLAGDGLYAYRGPAGQFGASLPPAGAYALIPLAVLPLPVAGWLLAAAGVAALVLALFALAGRAARRYGRRPVPVALAAVLLALAVEPVRSTLGRGTLDLLLFGLVAADVVALRRGAWARSRATWWPGRPASVPARDRSTGHVLRRAWATGAWAGAGVGLATALAIGPGLFIVYLALTRQWRAALTAVGTASVVTAGALLVAPRETATWFGEVLWRLDRTGGVDQVGNQSLAGVLARLYDSATTPVLLWSSFALLLLAVGMIRARSAHADGDEIAAFTLVGLTGAIIGPVTATHELIWVLPAVLILADAALRRRMTARRSVPGLANRFPGVGCAAAAVLTYGLFVVAPVWTMNDAFARNSYALALILLVNALPWRPGAAPAFAVDRWAGRRAAARTIPPARRPTGS